MQKIWLQIGFSMENFQRLHTFQVAHQCKNESVAIGEIIQTHYRLQTIINELEKRAHEAEKWKKKAEKQVGTVTKRTIAAGVKKNTDSKVISAKNTLNSQKPGGKR